MNFGWQHWLTIAVIAALIIGAIAFNVNVGMAALIGALVLTVARAADERAAFKAMPWNVIVMVTGVTVLVALLEKTGGMDLFARFIGNLATPATLTPFTAFFTGLVSIYSSTTGVVLPAMLPIVPGLIQHAGGGNPMALVSRWSSAGISSTSHRCQHSAPCAWRPRRREPIRGGCSTSYSRGEFR